MFPHLIRKVLNIFGCNSQGELRVGVEHKCLRKIEEGYRTQKKKLTELERGGKLFQHILEQKVLSENTRRKRERLIQSVSNKVFLAIVSNEAIVRVIIRVLIRYNRSKHLYIIEYLLKNICLAGAERVRSSVSARIIINPLATRRRSSVAASFKQRSYLKRGIARLVEQKEKKGRGNGNWVEQRASRTLMCLRMQEDRRVGRYEGR